VKIICSSILSFVSVNIFICLCFKCIIDCKYRYYVLSQGTPANGHHIRHYESTGSMSVIFR
jgi:hypothetical protein